jgi:Raf kinase inhibitor-like YbhB/YbcL family protein
MLTRFFGGLLMTASSFAITATPFISGGAPGGRIEDEYTCKGADVSPVLAWAAAPAGTKSLALIVDDPDAPGGVFTHWVVYGLPGSLRELKKGQLPLGAQQGVNDFGSTGYRGPCPPPGKPHRYFFTLYALDESIGWPSGSSAGELRRGMEGHILAQAKVYGTFSR